MSLAHRFAAAHRTLWSAAVLAFTFSLLVGGASIAAETPAAESIVVVALQGEVRVVMHGAVSPVKIGSEIELPAAIRTATTGSIELRQGRTTVAIAGDTQIEIPATALRGEPIDRLIQAKGNAFYNVAKRTTRKLRVETPYLVAVVKGTQFNVSVQDDGAMVSLFEGRLQILATDGSDEVDLNAGEIAIRHGQDQNIRVLRMDGSDTRQSQNDPSGDGQRPPVAVTPPNSAETVTPIIGGRALAGSTPVNGAAGVEARTGLDVTALKADADAAVDLGDGAVAPGVAANVSLGNNSVDVGVSAGVDVAGGTVDVGVSAGLDTGSVTANVGVDAGIDLSGGAVAADVGASIGLDAGAISADVDVNAGVDLSGAAVAVDVGASTNLDVGGIAADVSVDTGVAAGSGAVDLNLNAGLDVGPVDTSVAVDAGVDLGAGNVGADVSLGNVSTTVDVSLGNGSIDLGLGNTSVNLDLGLGGGNTSSGTTGGGGGLLGGLGGLLGHH